MNQVWNPHMVQTFRQTQLQDQTFSGQNLSSQNFQNANLVGADFSNANIRGANFQGAQLQNANFSGVKAGLPPQTRLSLFILAFLFVGLSGAVLGFASLIAAGMLQPQFIAHYQILPGLVVLVSLSVFVTVTIRHGFLLGMLIMTLAIAAQSAILGISAMALPGVGASALVMALAVVGTLAGASGIGLAIAMIQRQIKLVAALVSVASAVALLVIGSLANTIQTQVSAASYALVVNQIQPRVGALNIARALSAIATASLQPVTPVENSGLHLAIAIALVIAAVLIFLSGYTGWHSGAADRPEFTFTRRLVLALASLGGTNFRGSDLTEANFMGATVRNTTFKSAQIQGVNWFAVQGLERARLGNLYLQNPVIRRLVTTKSAQNQDFSGLHLRGINLAGADLQGTCFLESDLSEANLQHADLSHAKLVRTQLSHANLTGACLTAAFIEDWGISSETQLQDVQCEYVFTHLPTDTDPDPGRKPDNKRDCFAPGDFADFIQPLQDTLDLFHYQDVNIRAIAIVLNQLISNHPEADLKVAAIERRGANGESLLIKLVSHPITDLSTLEAEYFSNYNHLKRLSDQPLYTLLEQKDRHIKILAEWLRTILNTRSVSEALPPQPSAWGAKRVELMIGAGDFQHGFPVTLLIGVEGKLPSRRIFGHLPPASDLEQAYQHWQSSYRILGKSFRIKRKETQLKNVSIQPLPHPTDLAAPLMANCHKAAIAVEDYFNAWLNSETFRPLEQALSEELQRLEEVRIIIQVQDPLLRRLPWHLWQWFDRYRNAEVALGTLTSRQVDRNSPPKAKLRVLVILGSNNGIQVEADQALLERLPNAEITNLTEPSRQTLDATLFDPQGWDILCFAGHSSSKPDGEHGWLYLNESESLSLDQIQQALKKAIERGLKMAIFNACDGLGLAYQLATLNLPQMIVMREPIPDRVAQSFLQFFLTSFASGKSLYLAVREARAQLQRLESEFPCASWMPVISQNPSEIVWSWQDMQGVNQLHLSQRIEQLKVALIDHPDLDSTEQGEICEYLKALSIAIEHLTTPEARKLGETAFLYLKGLEIEWSDSPNLATLNSLLHPLLTTLSQNLTVC